MIIQRVKRKTLSDASDNILYQELHKYSFRASSRVSRMGALNSNIRFNPQKIYSNSALLYFFCQNNIEYLLKCHKYIAPFQAASPNWNWSEHEHLHAAARTRMPSSASPHQPWNDAAETFMLLPRRHPGSVILLGALLKDGCTELLGLPETSEDLDATSIFWLQKGYNLSNILESRHILGN